MNEKLIELVLFIMNFYFGNEVQDFEVVICDPFDELYLSNQVDVINVIGQSNEDNYVDQIYILISLNFLFYKADFIDMVPIVVKVVAVVSDD